MKEKIFILAAILMIITTAVNASSINGDYKGNPIVNVIVNGKLIKSDVPAMIIDGTTMIPLRSVSEAFGGVTFWDSQTYSVGITNGNQIPIETPTPTPPPSTNSGKVKGPLTIYSNDGKTYLGKLTANEYDTDSIYNEYGTYGSKYSTDSIMNEYGTYGSKYSSTSVFNDLASEPPIILDVNGIISGYLTTNKNIKGGVSPIGLKQFLKDGGY
jgi:hypothetical protein